MDEQEKANLERLVAEGKVAKVELTFDAEYEGRTLGTFYGTVYKRHKPHMDALELRVDAKGQMLHGWSLLEAISRFLYYTEAEPRSQLFRLYDAAFLKAFYEAYNVE